MTPRGQRPSWWPEDEPWPPTRPPWQVNRRRFIWRIGIVLIAVFVIFGIVSALGGHFFRNMEDGSGDGPPFWIIFPILFWSSIIGLVVFVSRRIGRGFGPIFDMIDASYKVSQGDYAVRIESGGNHQLRNLIGAFNSMTEKLEISDQQRRRLLADIAHELRTPLSVIQGNVEGMIDGVYPLDVDHLEPLLRESQLISRLLDDLQTLSRAEAGALDLYRESTDIQVLLADIVSAFQQRAAEAGIDLRLRPGMPTPELDIDPMRVRQVVENLVTNSIRHTPEGGMIELSATSEPKDVLIVIRDSGHGIPAEALPYIFDRFVKSADSGGSGLGLAIARRLIEAHGGTITASSIPDEGTTMEIRLPTEGSAPT